MIDNLILLSTHGLLLITAWRLLGRPDLDEENAAAGTKSRWGNKPGA
jgi:hypothetical protein